MKLTERPIMIRWRLRVLMAERHINNKELAASTGIHPTTISRLRNADGLKQINVGVLDALCTALECSPNELLEYTNGGESPDGENPQSPSRQSKTAEGKSSKGKYNSSNEGTSDSIEVIAA